MFPPMRFSLFGFYWDFLQTSKFLHHWCHNGCHCVLATKTRWNSGLGSNARKMLCMPNHSFIIPRNDVSSLNFMQHCAMQYGKSYADGSRLDDCGSSNIRLNFEERARTPDDTVLHLLHCLPSLSTLPIQSTLAQTLRRLLLYVKCSTQKTFDRATYQQQARMEDQWATHDTVDWNWALH